MSTHGNGYHIATADILDWIKTYEGDPFHALLCDPPYHLTSINKRFSDPDSAPAQYGKDGAFSRASRGFMGSTWDGGDIAFRPETWAALASVLYPGAFGMAFASSRGYHRMAVAIEDAGFILHPSIFLWAYGSGFPKATRIDTQVDKAAGVERSRVPANGGLHKNRNMNDDNWQNIGDDNASMLDSEPVTAQAQNWQGHRYGGQALKPAAEPILVFQKPYPRGKRTVESIVETGAGALNIDAGRIGVNPGNTTNGSANAVYGDLGAIGGEKWYGSDQGRWPANLVTDSEGAELIDAQSGELSGGNGHRVNHNASIAYAGSNPDGITTATYADSGGASRFFFTYDWSLEIAEQLAAADPVRYEAKASTTEREAGLAHLARQKVNDGRDTPIDNPYQRGETQRLNPHATVKPIALTEHLARLLLPPANYTRRLLVPFAGVGSEMIGAYRAGWDFIQGIELSPEYAAIAQARLDYWLHYGDIDPATVARLSNEDAIQLSLFE